MIISYAFLKNIFKNQCPEMKVLAEKLISIGFEVEEIIPGLNNQIITVKVLEVNQIEKDELFHIKIYDSVSTYDVITSCSKIKTGDVYPYASPGTTINGNELKVKNFGSINSNGMLLSYAELNLDADILTTQEKEGLLCLPEDTPIGQNFYELFWLVDPLLNLKIPYNRPDCYSFLGLLREIACAFEIPVSPSIKRDIHNILPTFHEKLLKRTISKIDFKKIEIQSKNSCPFYNGIILENITIDSSTFDIRKRLFSFHIKPINNVVDIANLLMFYYGQPLHTFDFDKIIGKHIIIRDAKPNETFIGIDEKTYSLTPEDLVISDEIHSIALAGIIGGKDTEITANTKTIFIESAYFSPITISQTSNRLNFVTDASSRFSRGVEQNQVREIGIFASYLISALCGGSIAGEIMGEGAVTYKPREISFTMKDFVDVTGFEINKYSATHILSNLEIPFEIKASDTILVKVPSFRENDLKESVDIIEEILRFVGYDKILPKPPRYIVSFQPENDRIQYNRILTEQLLGLGFQEIVTDSIVSDEEVQFIFPNEGEDLFQIANPLKSGLSFLSPNKLIQFMSVMKRNISRKQNHLRLFEIGKHYLKKENEFLNIALTGNTEPDSWYHPIKKIDFYFSKGVVESLLNRFSIPFEEKKTVFYNLFDCEESVDFYVGNHRIGSMGLVLPKINQFYEITQPVYFAFFPIHMIQKFLKKEIHYQPISTSQDISRDIAFVVSKSVKIRNLIEKIKSVGLDALKDVFVFDVYAGPKIEENLKSIAIRMIFNFGENVSKEKIQDVVDQIVLELEKTYHISIRK